jgi:hypothetical protein
VDGAELEVPGSRRFLLVVDGGIRGLWFDPVQVQGVDVGVASLAGTRRSAAHSVYKDACPVAACTARLISVRSIPDLVYPSQEALCVQSCLSGQPLDDLRAFPAAVRQDMGHALY